MTAIRRHLADATGDLHSRLDAHAGSLAPEALLAFFGRGVAAVEAGLDRADAARLLPEWPARRRGALLPAAAPQDPPRFDSDAEAWGALYVLEGSRLGGRVLARAPALNGHSFFNEGVPFWRTFLERLDTADAALRDRPGMVAGAARAYQSFPLIHSFN